VYPEGVVGVPVREELKVPVLGQPLRPLPFAPVPENARQYAVPMADGVRLATDVYLPGRGTRWPTLLARLPYDKAGDECFGPHMARWFTERGYAVVLQDVRGKLRSGGELAPFESETADGYHTLDWVSAQSWCDGAVGMFGDSYYGFTQWAAAASRHPVLRAIAPRVSTADFRYMLDRQGVFPLEVVAYWALETWVDEALYPYEGKLDWTVRPLARIVPKALGGPEPVGLNDWATRHFPAAATVPVRGDIPALHLGGFADFLLPGQLDTWRRACAAGGARQYLLLDATDHGWTTLRKPGRPYRDPLSSEATLQRFLEGYIGPLLPFFDHYLRNSTDYLTAPVRWRLTAGSPWQEDDQWPPKASRPITWTLTGRLAGGDGVLRLGPETTRSSASWTHDPADPVPSRIHPYYPLIEPLDERDIHVRADVLSFTTEPLLRRLDLAGPARASVSMSSDSDTAHLVATLCDVRPDGSTHRIVDGAVHIRSPWPARVNVDLGDAGYRLYPGHRLRLTLASSAFPRYAIHPGTDADPWTARQTEPRQNSIALGGADGAYFTCYAINGLEQKQ